MRYSQLSDLLRKARAAVSKGPLCLIFAEDEIELESTVRHHLNAGFAQTILFAPPNIALPGGLQDSVLTVDFDTHQQGAVADAINTLISACPGVWIYYCYNAEYLFHPFSETRNVAEMLAFHAEERREAMLTYVIDLYAGDLDKTPNAVSRDDAHIDRTGYYALNRQAGPRGPKLERQLDFFGGLRWRFEEHIPKTARRIDRIALFRAKPGLQLSDNHLFSDPEYNTYACPWHNNLTAAICSFRVAKALRTNPGSRFEIDTFAWHNSVRFGWTSQELMDLGLIEPGQWF
ncbi:MAG: hypothetical protein AAF667_00875 [Pseudomonadota bacterium]